MTTGLRRFLEPQPRARAGERCELCAEPVGEGHAHVADLETRNLLCACRPCYLLFTHKGAAAGRYRAVPDRYLHDAAFRLSEGQWDDLQIPVRVAFFFHNSSMGRAVAFYPSPAGATESLLPLETWQEVVAANPPFADVADDVEALLLQRTGDGFECFLIPIDVCYELVGLVRMHWKGFDGGQEAWREIDAFFDRLRERSRPAGHDRSGSLPP